MTSARLDAAPATITANETSAYMTAEELGVRLRLKATTIAAWSRQGKIPVHRLAPKVLRYRIEEVLAALESRSAAMARVER
jgi:predicted site-specific integrase-resolvase